jgi:hypothetical protein
MTALQHIYVTAHGIWTSGPWVGESAQFGLRLAIAETGAMPDKGTTFDIALNGDVVTDQGTSAGTHGTLTRTWTARRGPTGSNENADAGFQVDIAEDFWTFLDGIKAYVASTFKWTTVKLAPIGADGKTIGTSSVYTFTTQLAGSSASYMPPQLAVALTMRANILGRRGRGRVYMPAVASGAVSSDGTLAATPANTYRAALVALINNLQNVPGTPDYIPLVVVTSAGQASAVRPSEVRTGSRVDTIRSRREQIPETYTTTPL